MIRVCQAAGISLRRLIQRRPTHNANSADKAATLPGSGTEEAALTVINPPERSAVTIAIGPLVLPLKSYSLLPIVN